MGIKVHTIPVNPETRQVDIKRVRRAINPNTMLVSRSMLSLREVYTYAYLRNSSLVPL